MQNNNKIESFLTSLLAVTIPMLLLIVAITIKVAALFYRSFEIPNNNIRLCASIFLAISVSLTLLTVSVNSQLIKGNKWLGFPEIFALCSVMIMLFVFKVFESDNEHWSWYFQRVFLSLFLGSIEYVYSKLFVKKYEAENKLVNERRELLELRKKFKDTKRELYDTTEELNRTKQELESTKMHFPCRHCGEVLTSHSTWKKHEAKCDKNPKNN